MAKTESQKSAEAYRKTRKDYLQKRVSETQESLRTSGLSDKRKKKLQEQLKTFKDNLTKIKEQSSLKETKMAKQSLKDQYRKANKSLDTSVAGAKHGTGSTPRSSNPRKSSQLDYFADVARSYNNAASAEGKAHILEKLQQLWTERLSEEDRASVRKRKLINVRVLRTLETSSYKEQATTAGTTETKVITTAAPGSTKGNGKPQSKRRNPSQGKRPNPNVGERSPRFFEANRFADKYRTAYKDYQNGDISEEDFKTVTDKMDSYKDAVDTDFIKNSIARENGPLPTAKKSTKQSSTKTKPETQDEPRSLQQTVIDAWGGDESAAKILYNNNISLKDISKEKASGGNMWQAAKDIEKSIGHKFNPNAKNAPGLTRALKSYTAKPDHKGYAGGGGDDTGRNQVFRPKATPATKKPATKPKSNPSSTVDLPNAKMRELNNRLIESREKLGGLSNSTTNRTKIKALKDSIFWDELDLLGYYEKLTPAKQKALDITKVIPADNIAKILKADKDNEFEKLKTSHPELLKAPRKAAPPKKVTKPTTSKPTAARDNVADIKKYALNLVNTKEENKKTSLRNTIAEIYGSLTASERKKLNLGTYVSKVDLKKMSSNNTAVKKYMDSPTAFLQSAAEVRHAFAKDKKMAESNGRKPIAPKATQALDKKKDDKPNTDANGKRYTKRGVTQMLKQLREQQETGRKTSNAYKQREEDIKRLTKVLKTLSSANPNISLSDKHRITVIANSLEVVTANTVWGTGATYDELAKALKKIGIKGVTADGLEGDFDEGDGVTSGSEPVYKYFDKILGDDDSEELAGADGAFVFATLYIAGLLGEDELKTVVPNANIRKLILKCGKKTEVSAARQSIKNTGLAKIAKLVFGVDTKPKASGNRLHVDLSDVDGAEDYDLEDVRDSIIQIARTHLRLTLVGANGTDDGVVAVGERGGDAGVYLSVKGNEDEVAISFNQDELTLSI